MDDIAALVPEPVEGRQAQGAGSMSVKLGEGIVGKVAQRGKAEIVNDVQSDVRSTKEEKKVSSLLCVPLKAKNNVIGVIILHHTTPIIYTAGDLKLLNTLASQAAPAIENATRSSTKKPYATPKNAKQDCNGKFKNYASNSTKHDKPNKSPKSPNPTTSKACVAKQRLCGK